MGISVMSTDFTVSRAYRLNSADRVETGAGKLGALPRIVGKLSARRVVIATSKSVVASTPHIRRACELLSDTVVATFPHCRQHSPDSDIAALVDMLAQTGADAVVSIGGSSIFDTVKIAVGRLATDHEPMPQIAIPTTLSGGEFTSGAGYTEEATQSKKLVLDGRVAPQCVILDPDLTVETPDELWLSSGVKALDHALEAVWAIRPHPYADALALEGIRLLYENLPHGRDRQDINARGACQVGAWMSISAASVAGMRLSHFLGHQIGARMHIPHGITSCILLPTVMRHLRDQTLDAQCRIAAVIGVDGGGRSREAIADAAADRLEQFIAGLGLPHSMKAAGAGLEDVEAITEASFAAAQQLGLAQDLPQGAESIRQILLSA